MDRPEAEKPLEEGEYRQTPEELEAYKQFSMCINCMLCYAACPVYGSTPTSSGRPRSRSRSATTKTARDEGARERMEVLSQHEASGACTFVGECTTVCPKHVDPAGAIQRYKLDASLDWLKSFFMPRGAA
jgi:fumarate reductase iron-sulfur subunit